LVEYHAGHIQCCGANTHAYTHGAAAPNAEADA
jgi:hypothetical protein